MSLLDLSAVGVSGLVLILKWHWFLGRYLSRDHPSFYFLSVFWCWLGTPRKSFSPCVSIFADRRSYPIFLRAVLWTSMHILPANGKHKAWRDTIKFILRYPRRVYTNLFPSSQTWWLFTLLVALNVMDWIVFEVFNLHNPPISSIPWRYRVVDGLFQALAVRSSGFAVVLIGSLAIRTQVVYVVMMYISAFPVAITMRNSNVYEERSLAIYAEDIKKRDHWSSNTKPKSSMNPINRSIKYAWNSQKTSRNWPYI